MFRISKTYFQVYMKVLKSKNFLITKTTAHLVKTR